MDVAPAPDGDAVTDAPGALLPFRVRFRWIGIALLAPLALLCLGVAVAALFAIHRGVLDPLWAGTCLVLPLFLSGSYVAMQAWFLWLLRIELGARGARFVVPTVRAMSMLPPRRVVAFSWSDVDRIELRRRHVAYPIPTQGGAAAAAYAELHISAAGQTVVVSSSMLGGQLIALAETVVRHTGRPLQSWR